MKEATILRTCCFIGHRNTQQTQALTETLHNTIENLITNDNVSIFLFGSKSKFNDLCLSVVSQLKVQHPHIQRIYVRAEFPQINEDYKDYLLQFYENTYYPPEITQASKAIYVERNYHMIDNSYYCIFFYDENGTLHKPQRGTKPAYHYAKRKQRVIKNLFYSSEKSGLPHQ